MHKLTRAERLRGREAIGSLFGEGSKGRAGTVLVRALPNATQATRAAFVAGKKTGRAVERNRMRRRLRAAYRVQKAALPGGWDLALVASRRVLEVAWRDLVRDTARAVEAAVEDFSGRPRCRRNG